MNTNLDPYNASTAWVCEDCFLTFHGFDAIELGSHPDRPPLGLLGTETFITDGMLSRDHDCEDILLGRYAVIGCGEELRDFDARPCAGCGNHLAGKRRALTFWQMLSIY